MARNAEKAQSTLSRWVALQKGENKPVQRPKFASYYKTVKSCVKWRNQILSEMTNLITLIQNESLDVFKIREMNDQINKLIREKFHCEKRIIELGGPDYIKLSTKVDDEEIFVGTDGYKYFGAAKNLPGVRELLNSNLKPSNTRDRKELLKLADPSYYGFRDEEDANLLILERQLSEKALNHALEVWKDEQRKKGFDPDLILQMMESSISTEQKLEESLVSLVCIPTKEQLDEIILRQKKEELMKTFFSDD